MAALCDVDDLLWHDSFDFAVNGLILAVKNRSINDRRSPHELAVVDQKGASRAMTWPFGTTQYVSSTVS